MKVGDYVRFKTLSREIKIGKVIDIIEPDKESMKKYCVYDLDNDEATVDDYIIKSSQTIEGVLEIGDYVNGSLVRKISKQTGTIFCELGHITKENYSGIYSIVTKEQFESMEYKVEE